MATDSKLARGRQIGDQVRRVGSAEARDRVPARRGVVALDKFRVVAGGHVEEVAGVLAGVCDGVERGVDEPEPVPLHLAGDRHQSRPLRAAQRGSADVIPTGAAR